MWVPSFVPVSIDGLGRATHKGRPYDEAIAVLDQSLVHVPESPQLLRALGFAQQLKGRFEAAQRTFSRLVEIRPSDSSGFFYLASSYLEAGQPENALLSNFEKALRLSPEDGRIYYLQGLIHSPAGRGRSRSGAVQSMPRIRSGLCSRPLSASKDPLHARKPRRRRLRDSRRAIEIDPGFPQAHFQAAQVLARLGRREEAQARLKAYRELQAKNVDKGVSNLQALISARRLRMMRTFSPAADSPGR